MWIDSPPFVWFFLGALLLPFVRGTPRKALLLLVPLLGGLNLIGAEAGTRWQVGLFDYTLTLLRVDRLALLFGYLFHVAAFLGNLFALHLEEEDRDTLQHVAALVYAGSALGAIFAGDFLTLFVFWEGLALSSVFLIWARGSTRAFASGLRYLLINVVSGVILMAGAMLHYQDTGSLAFEFIGLGGLASWLLLVAFGIKAGFPLLHNWLVDAYPEGTATGTVFLSAFTTKVAVYALARGFPGTELLLWVGVVMTCFPIFYAVIENDLRRVLSYSMINQIGFMVVGIGIGSALAVNGAVAHAFNDVIFKGLLMMSMGAVLHVTGRVNGTDLGGLFKTMPWTATFCLVGAASISAVPLFSGFVSKSMVVSATIEEGYGWAWLLLLFASAGVVEHAGIKIPYFSFFAHDSGIRAKEPPKNMLLAMGIAAVLCIFIGSYPWALYSLLPFPVDYHPFDPTHVFTQVQILVFASLAVFWMMRWGSYPPERRAINIDFDWIYRRAGARLVRIAGSAIGGVDRRIRSGILGGIRKVLDEAFRHHGPQGILARTWPLGSMVLWVAVLLGAFLLFYYI